MNNKLLKNFSVSVVASSLFSIASIYPSGAGVIPYVKQQGQIHFLLGEDYHRTGMWTDFGESGQADKATAAKEGHEETMGVFAGEDPRGGKVYNRPIRRKATGETYFMRRLHNRHATTIHFSKTDRYKTYFIDVTNAVCSLGGKRKAIQKLRKQRAYWNKRRLEKGRKEYRVFTEKIQFKWFTQNEFII